MGMRTVARDEAVLVLVDIQERLADVMERRGAVVAASLLLARAAAVLGIPTIVTRQYPTGLGDTVPELRGVVGDVEPVDKVTFSCLEEPAFRQRLVALDRRQVILAGMEAHICITQTALALLAHGFDPFVVADAVCSRRDRDRDLALHRLRAEGVVVAPSESVIYEALGCAGTAEFRAVLDAVKAHDAG